MIVAVPAIIERDEFEAVQSMLKVRNPKVTPPRVVTGPTLLTGLATCATCGGGMTLRTGTSKNGTVHRYYTCSNAARAGKSVCTGRSIRMDTLDELVVEHLSDRLLTSTRLTEMLAAISAGRAAKAAEVDGRLIRLQEELTEAETRLKRIYTMIEDGIAEMDDILRERIAGLKIDRERIQASLDRARTHAVPASDIPPAVVEEFGRMMRENITSGDIPFRKAYIQAVVDQVQVGDREVKIIGSNAAIHQTMTGGKKFLPGVRSFERKWRASSATGPRSASSATGDRSASSAEGDRSASLATGVGASATVDSGNGIAIATSGDGKVRGLKDGDGLVLVRRDRTGAILDIWHGIVGRDGIEAGVFYALKDGKPVKSDEDGADEA